ncbi:MAG TPA: ATP-binding protein [Solirubrobacteraceae bacterium]
MAESPPNVRLSLANTPENVVLVREMLSGIAQAIDLDGSDLNDARIAVTEACNNVVLHAYEGEEGPLEVEVYLTPRTLSVLVRDHGVGIPGEPESPELDAGGLGLHVIQTLAHGVEFSDGGDGGTEVWMEFAAANAGSLALPPEGRPGVPTLALPGAPTTTICIGPIGLARTILPRLVIALAARAHFSTDRISDAQMLADALVAHAHGAVSGDKLSIDVVIEPRDLELHISPLHVGRAQQLIGESELDGLGRVIEKLTDRHEVVAAGSHETLTLGLSDPR